MFVFLLRVDMRTDFEYDDFMNLPQVQNQFF